jgi:Fe-S oxidoreductase
MGRANGVYEAPRQLLEALDVELVEMKRCRTKGMCCGAGGAQMFKEDEPGDKRINTERVEEALGTGATAIAANCPFCITMLRDGVSEKGKEDEVPVYDLAELILDRIG